MQKKKGSPYSSSRALFEESILEEAKSLVEQGNVSLTLFDEGAKEAHGNVYSNGQSYACRLDFGANDLLNSARCSCKGSLAAPCVHLAALLLQLEKETGGYSLGGQEGFSLFLKALVSRGFSSLPYLKRALKEYKSRQNEEKWEGKEAISCLKLIFSSYTGYSGFGDSKVGFLLVPMLEELPLSEEEKGLLFGEIPSTLSSQARKSFYLASFSSPVFSSCCLERFEAGLTNGRSYDLLRLYEKEEGKLLALLPPFTLHLLCQADFRFHGFLPLSEELLEKSDKDGIALLAKNPNASLPSESWQKLGKELEREGEVSLALSCYKRCFGVGGGDFPTLCSYYKGLSEEEKLEKGNELLASLANSKMRLPFAFLLGKGKESDIAFFMLSDFPCLKEELSSYSYQNVLTSKLLLTLKKLTISKEEEKAIWDCFEAFSCLAGHLMDDETKKLSKRTPASRARYLSLLEQYDLLSKQGFKRKGE